MNKHIPKTSLQEEFEKSAFAKGADLMRYDATGGYVFSSGKDAFEMFLFTRSRKEAFTAKQELIKLININLKTIKEGQDKYNGVYLNTFHPTVSSPWEAHTTKCSLRLETGLDVIAFELEVSEYVNHELFIFTRKELESRGVNVITNKEDWEISIFVNVD